jgi:hypothetical protein
VSDRQYIVDLIDTVEAGMLMEHLSPNARRALAHLGIRTAEAERHIQQAIEWLEHADQNYPVTEAIGSLNHALVLLEQGDRDATHR